MNPKRTITTDLFPKVSYSRYGCGPAVMLIHGFPASGSLWNPILSQLARSMTVLVPDIPGTGESLPGKDEVSMEDLATIVPAILDDADIGEALIAGHSMGGYVALAAAERFVERFTGLSLVHSTALADDDEKKDKRRKAISLIRGGGREQFINEMIPAVFSDSFKKKHPQVVQERVDDGLKLSSELLTAFYNAMIARPERLEVLRSAGLPVQWILGRDDTTIPWRTCVQQSSLPIVSFIEVYEDCAHMSMIEQKELLAKDLLSFNVHCLHRLKKRALR